jgi:hypothetical protein
LRLAVIRGGAQQIGTTTTSSMFLFGQWLLCLYSQSHTASDLSDCGAAHQPLGLPRLQQVTTGLSCAAKAQQPHIFWQQLCVGSRRSCLRECRAKGLACRGPWFALTTAWGTHV